MLELSIDLKELIFPVCESVKKLGQSTDNTTLPESSMALLFECSFACVKCVLIWLFEEAMKLHTGLVLESNLNHLYGIE